MTRECAQTRLIRAGHLWYGAAFTDEQCGAAPVEWLKAAAHQQIVLPTQSSGTEETQ
jgi:hypothetical protein